MAEAIVMSRTAFLPARTLPRSAGWCRYGSAQAQVLDLRVPAKIRIPGGAGQARITCWGDRREAARNALEGALGDKKETFEKWNEEIKKREAGGGGPKGRGRGWGGGGGGGGGSGGGGGKGDGDSDNVSNEGKWEEAKQIAYAFGGLAALYLILTEGKAMVALFMNSVLWVSRGFKRPAPRRPVLSGADGRGSAADDVRRKWGSDD
ncbi:hypothetical protein MPTK1_3g02960 [Marchantia polymorpha subsp. ruderalis]|uniref:Uncharacterized protein n=2 Tax=Marchantia polymorpha TaxID=3197 RepID=A0AAF6AWW1_MARPO|nr:hypothetical protein MARPO_0252s0005 [Marchantia polymorpha]PTQ47930.1 hypothetical protein MARPO_0007s0283 [Marchantia polymorpha]BBN04245.1 hypothetical protein Mp_3g02960 [Marchantia polymorpha subsp. ruderalis]|eukprot:PTQ26963.1 hypothetical protein MARPO_0252s0005 [Marchantia polymorpha]